MLGKASHLALPGLFLSLVAAAPAMAQSRAPAGAAPASCYRTISEASGAAARSQDGADRCSAPRERMVYGGWMAHAIMMVRDGRPGIGEDPTRAAGWRESLPSFALPPTYR
jgi:hypothetical protein